MLEPVDPCTPVAGWIGGKRNLSRRICELINTVPHDGYAEPFVGMGGIFLRRSMRPKVEVINDLSGDVVNLFRILQRHYQPFLDMLKWQVASRREFDRLLAMDPTTLTDLERAARFVYVQRLAFGGKVAGRNFGVDTKGPTRFDLTKLVPTLEDVHERLQGVWVENLSWDVFMKRWDRPGMLFYLDPPYFGCEEDYGADLFSRGQFEVMAEQLATLKGDFILSINDRPRVRQIFKAFPMAEVPVTYTVGGGKQAAEFGELIISSLADIEERLRWRAAA